MDWALLKSIIMRHQPHGNPDYNKGFLDCKESILQSSDYVFFGIDPAKPDSERTIQTIRDAEFVCELPPSPHPWKMTVFGSSVIFVNPDHPPMELWARGLREIRFAEERV